MKSPVVDDSENDDSIRETGTEDKEAEVKAEVKSEENLEMNWEEMLVL